MNSKQNTEYDLAGNYLNRESIEKAPEGFTERVMSQIRMEKAPAIRIKRSRYEMIIAGIALLTSVSLLTVAWITNSSDSLFFNSISQGLTSLNNMLPDLNATEIPRFTLPGIIFYISAGILFLTLFDLALNRIFHRKT